jgi:hypothetical protein
MMRSMRSSRPNWPTGSCGSLSSFYLFSSPEAHKSIFHSNQIYLFQSILAIYAISYEVPINVTINKFNILALLRITKSIPCCFANFLPHHLKLKVCASLSCADYDTNNFLFFFFLFFPFVHIQLQNKTCTNDYKL